MVKRIDEESQLCRFRETDRELWEALCRGDLDKVNKR